MWCVWEGCLWFLKETFIVMHCAQHCRFEKYNLKSSNFEDEGCDHILVMLLPILKLCSLVDRYHVVEEILKIEASGSLETLYVPPRLHGVTL